MKHYFRLILILLIPLLLCAWYGMSEMSLVTEEIIVEKADFSELYDFLHPEIKERQLFVADSLRKDSIKQAAILAEKKRKEELVDTSFQRMLFFGDSMLENLGPRMGDYASQNGYDLTFVCWYSSSSKVWAESDTLQYFLDKVKPTFVMISLGGNEQFVRDLPQREKYIKKILDQIGDIPYIWICTPSWKGDKGFNGIAEKLVGKRRFYDSRRLTLERGSDHAHPTRSEARRWMDSIAVWMQSEETLHPIRMKFPQKDVKRTHHSHFLAPPEQ